MDADRLAWLRHHTRARILAAAEERFAADGYDAARVDDVAAGAGVSKSHLYYHFPTKASLLACLVELRTAELLEAKDRLFGERPVPALIAEPRELSRVLQAAFRDVLMPRRPFIRIVLVEAIRNPDAARPVFDVLNAMLDDSFSRLRALGRPVDESAMKALWLHFAIIPSLYVVALNPEGFPEDLVPGLASLEALLVPTAFGRKSDEQS